MKCKVLPHHRLVQMLLDGAPHSPVELRSNFEADERLSSLAYRLPTYIYDVKKIGGRIRAVQEGRNVVSYQLVNPQSFNRLGQLVKNARDQNGKMKKTTQKGVVEDRETVTV